MVSPRLERRIGQEVIDGWKLTSLEDDRAVLKRPNYGSTILHVLIAALTIWWTLGLVNVLYAIYAYRNHSEYKIVEEHEPLDRAEAVSVLKHRYARGDLDDEAFERRLARLTALEGKAAREFATENE